MALANVNTLVTLHDEIERFCNAHEQIKRFHFEFEEQLENFSTEDKDFPIVFMTPLSFGKNGQTDVHNIRIYVLNRINRDRDNTLDNINDTSLILNDIIKYWNSSNRQSEILLLNDPIGTPLNNAELDYLQGYYADFDFELKSYSRCDIPIPQGVPTIIDGVKTIEPFLTCSSLTECSTFIGLSNSVTTNSNDIDNIEINIINIENDLLSATTSILQNESDIATNENDIINLENEVAGLSSSLTGYLPLIGGTISGNLVVAGNFEVLGTMSTIDTETLQAKDNNIVLNYNGTHLSADGGGITVEDGVSNGNDSSWLINGDGNWYTNQSILIDSTSRIDLANDLTSDNYITSDVTYNRFYHMGQSILQNGNSLRLNDLFTTGLIRAYFNTNTRIGQATGYDTIFEDDSTNPLMTIKQNGNVGIGTITPTNKLEVNGTVRFNDPSQTNGWIEYEAAGANSPVLKFQSASITRSGSGGLIIDETSGGANGKLQVLGNILINGQDNMLRFGSGVQVGTLATDWSTSDTIFDVKNIGTQNTSMRVHGSLGVGVNYSGTTPPTNGAIIEGNVGIGTTTPSEKLEVDGNAKVNALVVGTSTVYSNSININNVGSYRIGNGEVLKKTSSDLSIANGTIVAEFTGGNVGIGTTTPSQKLHVDGNIRVGDTADNVFSNKFTALSSGDVEVRSNTGSNLLLNANAGDNVGIGTSTPATKLDVDGEITVAIERWTIDLMDSLSTTIYADEDISITAVDNIVNTPTTTITVNGSSYTLGDPISLGDEIGISVDTASVIKLKIEK